MAQGYTGGNVTSPGYGQVVQVVNTQTGAYATGSTAIPNDDTIPQITEGTEFMTLAITPTNASNKLKIDVVFTGDIASTNQLTIALFQDSTANALACNFNYAVGVAGITTYFTHYMTAGTASSTTFKVRAGTGAGNAVYFNGYNGGRTRGGVMASSITITEIKA